MNTGWTLQDLTGNDYEVTGCCSTCNIFKPINIYEMIKLFGPSAQIRTVTARMRCGECGKKNVTPIVRPTKTSGLTG